MIPPSSFSLKVITNFHLAGYTIKTAEMPCSKVPRIDLHEPHNNLTFTISQREKIKATMTYNEADKLIKIHSDIIGKPILNQKCNLSDDRRITSLLISPKEKIQQVFSAWWYNGHDNEKALVKIKKDLSFEIFIISYNPADDRSIYYLRLSKYLELDRLVS